jgi:hypothetical protein
MANVELALSPPLQIPSWLQQLQAEPLDEINTALNSKMHRERWKYTKTQPVLDLLVAPTTPPGWPPLPNGITLSECDLGTIKPPMNALTKLDFAAAPEACSALCYQDKVYVLEVNAAISDPLVLTYQQASAPVVIKLAANARLDLRETFSGEDPQQQTMWIELGPGSQLSHSRNNFSRGAHWQFLNIHMDRDANYTLHNHSTGADLKRQDIRIQCNGSGAHAEIASAAFIGAGDHLDQQVTIEHAAPHSTSTQAFHNIAGDKAKVTFNGRIHIHPGANGVDAHLSNKNLGLSDRAVINTKPELEIYTDDVKCSHGATVGQLDADHEFYCASRGIDPAQARSLLSRAFLNVCTRGPLSTDARAHFHDQTQAQFHDQSQETVHA